MTDTWTLLAEHIATSTESPEHNAELQRLLLQLRTEYTSTEKTAKQWTDYYTGEYTVIRKDKLAMLNRSHRTLRETTTPTDATYCSACGTKLKPMICDTFNYCPNCDLPQEDCDCPDT